MWGDRGRQAIRQGLWGVVLVLSCGLVGEGKAQVQAAAGDSLSLDAAVALALQKNENLLIAQAESQKTRQQVREARADGLPQLDLGVDYSRSFVLPSFVFGGNRFSAGTENSLVGRLNLRQSLYSGGRVGASLAAARSSSRYASEAERGVRQAVRAQVETALYEVLLARELDRVSVQALATARGNLRQVQALKDAGRAPEYDLLQAEVRVSTAQADSISGANRVRLAEMSFSDVIGQPLTGARPPKGRFRQASPLAAVDLDRLMEIGQKRRPQLRQVRHLLELSNRSVDVEKAGGRPELDLVSGGQMQFQSDAFELGDGDLWSRSWNAGLALTMPLFDGNRTRARVAQARIEVQRLGLEIEQLARSVQLEIGQAYLERLEAAERSVAQKRAVNQAQKGLAVAQARYKNGVGTQLEIQDAQLILVQTQNSLATARRDEAAAWVRLEQAVGILGEPLDSGDSL